MLKVKIINVFILDAYTVEEKINDFLNSLPQKGDEVTNIKYAVDSHGNICKVMISYKEY